MEVCNLNKTKKYLDNVQKFLDYTDNIQDEELREKIRNSFFASIRSICEITNFDIQKIGNNGR